MVGGLHPAPGAKRLKTVPVRSLAISSSFLLQFFSQAARASDHSADCKMSSWRGTAAKQTCAFMAHVPLRSSIGCPMEAPCKLSLQQSGPRVAVPQGNSDSDLAAESRFWRERRSEYVRSTRNGQRHSAETHRQTRCPQGRCAFSRDRKPCHGSSPH